jgi:threonylcarbamoyladenosine tRNA methylthiotransferase CDKAL1
VKAYVESHGCTMNYGEGRIASALIAAGGYQLAERAEDSDIVVLNTCAVIGFTERKMISRLAEFSRMGKRLVVTGCMAPTKREAILEAAPGALICNPGNYEMLGSLLGLNFSRDQDCWNSPDRNDIIIPLAQGCLSRCTYCFSRIARPKLRSLNPAGILDAVRKNIRPGRIREFLLSGMDAIAYGRDLKTTLPELIEQILAIEGDFRLRVGMMSPSLLAPLLGELLDVYDDRRVYKFFHIPFQSGSDRILKLMKRGNTAGEFVDMAGAIRRRYPEATLSTDIIVGFPTETEEDFEQSLQVVRSVAPDIVNVTRFSPREGTPAASMHGQIPGWVVKERSRRATELRFAISGRRNSEYEGRNAEVLMTEEGKNGYSIGRLGNYRQIIVGGTHLPGRTVNCLITGSTPIHLIGTAEEMPLAGSEEAGAEGL